MLPGIVSDATSVSQKLEMEIWLSEACGSPSETCSTDAQFLDKFDSIELVVDDNCGSFLDFSKLGCGSPAETGSTDSQSFVKFDPIEETVRDLSS